SKMSGTQTRRMDTGSGAGFVALFVLSFGFYFARYTQWFIYLASANYVSNTIGSYVGYVVSVWKNGRIAIGYDSDFAYLGAKFKFASALALHWSWWRN